MEAVVAKALIKNMNTLMMRAHVCFVGLNPTEGDVPTARQKNMRTGMERTNAFGVVVNLREEDARIAHIKITRDNF
jgi:hypothetical protein